MIFIFKYNLKVLGILVLYWLINITNYRKPEVAYLKF